MTASIMHSDSADRKTCTLEKILNEKKIQSRNKLWIYE